MKFFAVVLITTLVCFIHASKLDQPCRGHKECGQKDLGCFEDKCQWIQNYFTDEKVRDSYYAKELDDPCVTYKQCSRIPADAGNEIVCYSMACISRKKRDDN